MAVKNIKTRKIIWLFLFNVLSLGSYAQCNYDDDSDAPEELYRKRVKESGMRYDKSYTMF